MSIGMFSGAKVRDAAIARRISDESHHPVPTPSPSPAAVARHSTRSVQQRKLQTTPTLAESSSAIEGPAMSQDAVHSSV